MQEVGKILNLIKEKERKILFSTSITKLTVEEDTVAYKEKRQMSHEGILEILGHVEIGTPRKTLENLWIPQLRCLRLHKKCLIGCKTTKHLLNSTKQR